MLNFVFFVFIPCESFFVCVTWRKELEFHKGCQYAEGFKCRYSLCNLPNRMDSTMQYNYLCTIHTICLVEYLSRTRDFRLQVKKENIHSLYMYLHRLFLKMTVCYWNVFLCSWGMQKYKKENVIETCFCVVEGCRNIRKKTCSMHCIRFIVWL